MSDKAVSKKWLTVGDVAEELEVSEWSVRKMIERGELPATKIGRKPLIKINPDRFREWLEQNA